MVEGLEAIAISAQIHVGSFIFFFFFSSSSSFVLQILAAQQGKTNDGPYDQKAYETVRDR
jgi:hypothetical protein